MTDRPVTVVVGRFGPVIAIGLRQVLEDDRTIDVIGADLDCAELEAVVSTRAPEVAILDEGWVAASSLPRRLTNIRSSIRLVVLAYRPTRGYAMRLLSFGVTACLPKDAPTTELSRTIHLAAAGTLVLNCAPETPSERKQRGGGQAYRLTPREGDVFECLRLAHTNAEIALLLGISVETVRSHAAHIYRKLGVRTRQDLVGIDLPAPVSRSFGVASGGDVEPPDISPSVAL